MPILSDNEILLSHKNAKDITGRVFSSLTALYPTEKRDKKGYLIWHCRCECGKELDISYNVLLYTDIRSCGCRKQEHIKKLSGQLNRVDGTSFDMLMSNKVAKNNTTGYRGVYFSRGKYIAKIVIQKKQYLLGTFETLEEAAQTRQAAENALRDILIPNYEKYRQKAAQDPDWARQNPFRILINKQDSLWITTLPNL